mmetsp:Transcript_18749/g.36739  ORF Transcript_18749/g.36739 Transcript_18749/m.36739 type:complete len:86 (+) Transcript_18749:76-333(+)|eukprot:CAMPEP_0171500666 /NCGR_PEP_ID=MMETSP0958-20121227/9113_1 /TAXON_ID=87120 /ORGANISM="Aurantiochytrium limacinum, Strain ATCCMYA-1381" /LENGTH=85 /DNA_ID=CAMNT_0012035363 /DNA_START=60 /DNA_END=317 /DNA_ORIENTATION=-
MNDGKQVAYAQPVGQPQPTYAQPQVAVDPRVAMRGGQPGGYYEHEKYCGVISLLIGFCLFPCICCCPCDDREVYVEPSGRRIVLG